MILVCVDCDSVLSFQRTPRGCLDGKLRCKSCAHKQRLLKYNHSSKGKAAYKRYSQTDKFKATTRKYRTTPKGKAKMIEIFQRRYWKDPDYQRMKAVARVHGVEPELLAQIKDRDKTCQLCGSDQNLTFDHIHPVSRGGQGTVENLQVLCGPCNSFKSNRLFLPGGGMIVSL